MNTTITNCTLEDEPQVEEPSYLNVVYYISLVLNFFNTIYFVYRGIVMFPHRNPVADGGDVSSQARASGMKIQRSNVKCFAIASMVSFYSALVITTINDTGESGTDSSIRHFGICGGYHTPLLAFICIYIISTKLVYIFVNFMILEIDLYLTPFVSLRKKSLARKGTILLALGSSFSAFACIKAFLTNETDTFFKGSIVVDADNDLYSLCLVFLYVFLSIMYKIYFNVSNKSSKREGYKGVKTDVRLRDLLAVYTPLLLSSCLVQLGFFLPDFLPDQEILQGSIPKIATKFGQVCLKLALSWDLYYVFYVMERKDVAIIQWFN